LLNKPKKDFKMNESRVLMLYLNQSSTDLHEQPSNEDPVPWGYYLYKHYSWNNRYCDTNSSAPLHKIDKDAHLKEELCDNKAGSLVNLESRRLAFIWKALGLNNGRDQLSAKSSCFISCPLGKGVC
jgi:hypothetical protein